ncbi:MAG: DEAD/DEAH box helicase [Calothrix sp. FI2-JRJ7]|jgi:superfamily II DNA or RNA helicase|nr:DEAD/DEAH box helicase [Calothrix sp. FI2-JRJ7]
MQPVFQVGQLVCLRAEPSRLGPIIEILPPVSGQHRYRVFHSLTQIGEYHEEQLLAVDDTSNKFAKITEILTAGQWLEVDKFRAQLTASRLSNPQIDNLYALQAARIQFIPFQFKPLLRFLRAEQPRLLIADEVGVGKTIEAGLILRELQSRQHLEKVLIVCGQKDLVPKWQKEMRRFDEDFRPLTAENLNYCLRESHLDGVWPQQYSRAIVHLELLRMEKYVFGQGKPKSSKYQPGLFNLEPPPKFDLVIVDEAHHLRNPESCSHEVAQFLCEISEAVVFLSATPLHLGNKNLYTLLNLLRPDLFIDETVFNEMVEPNRYINQAIRCIRHQAPENNWLLSASEALEKAVNTDWGKKVLNKDFRFINWSQKLSQSHNLTDVERISCLRDLEEVHTLAHVMNRTRRRDISKFTIREPQTILVPFTQEQQEFYEALLEFRTRMLLQDHDAQIVRFILDTLERQVSSCLPALVPLLDTFISTGRFSSQVASDDDFEEQEFRLSSELVEQSEKLRQLAAKLPKEDPKFNRLLEIVKTAIYSNEGPGKVLVFSFFLKTIFYLEEQLQQQGIRIGVITSKTPDEEREILRERFRYSRDNLEAIDVLLSSEVGCEGLDYEFCDRLVNYDIPWNPMRIEQRIGRIDRYGQKSEKVLIYNFVTPDTVEERIFFRCFERLGIFQDTIGDLEEVLGNTVQDLTRIALDPNLTPQQAEQKAQQKADNVLRLAEEQRRLESEGDNLLGLDTSFTEEVENLIDQGRFVKPDDLRQMITKFLVQPSFGGQITADSRHSGLYRLRLNKDGRNTLLEKVRELNDFNRTTRIFTDWLEGNEAYWTIIFEQQVALENRDIPFITPIHPLAKLAANYWASIDEPLVTQILIHDNSLPSGHYLFSCDLWETVAVRSETQLVSQVWNLECSCLVPEIASVLGRLLSSAEQPSEFINIERQTIELAIQQLDEAAHQQRLEALTALRERNDNILNNKLASLDSYYQNRSAKVANELRQSTNERIIKMKEAEARRLQRNYETRRRELENRREADIVSKRIAVGILNVKGDTKYEQQLPRNNI